MDKKTSISVLIPVYNEDEKILLGIISGVRDILTKNAYSDFEIIVIDDGSRSPLREGDISAAGGRLIVHEKNMGYGASLKNGLRNSAGDVIVITDADGTYPIDAIPVLLKEMGSADMVVGARTGKIVETPFVRQPAKWILKKAANYLAGRKIPDLNSGLRAFRKSAAMEFIHLFPQGFSFTTTITLAFLSDDRIVKFVPINYYKREAAKSKIKPISDTKNILLTIIRTIVYFEPLKVFLPAGLTLITLGFLTLVISVIMQMRHLLVNLPDGTISVLTLSGIQIIVIGLLADLIIRRSGK